MDPEARLQQLAQVWLDAPDRNTVTAAANEIYRVLAADRWARASLAPVGGAF